MIAALRAEKKPKPQPNHGRRGAIIFNVDFLLARRDVKLLFRDCDTLPLLPVYKRANLAALPVHRSFLQFSSEMFLYLTTWLFPQMLRSTQNFVPLTGDPDPIEWPIIKTNIVRYDQQNNLNGYIGSSSESLRKIVRSVSATRQSSVTARLI